MSNNTVTVRWWDGYMEEFDASEVRFGSDLLFLRLKDGKIDISLCAKSAGLA